MTNFRCKKSSNPSSRSKDRSVATDASYFSEATAVNLGYIYAERGSNSLPYDYPYIEANGARASLQLATTFQPQKFAMKSTNNRDSTGTCDGYIEIPAKANDKCRPHPTSCAVTNSLSNISEQPFIVSPSSSGSNSTDHKYCNTNHVLCSNLK